MNRQREVAEKTNRIVRLLEEENLGGVLLNAQHNFAWLTGGGRSGIDTSRDPGAANLFVRRDGRRYVLANRIEMSRLLAEELNGLGFEPVEFGWEEERADPTFVIDKARALVEGGTTELGTDFVVTGGRTVESELTKLRYRLTRDELDRYRQLGNDAGKAVGEVARTLQPGQTELEIACLTSDALARCDARAVVLLVAADERLKLYRHPVPTIRKWGKVVMIVVCARRGGLTVSLSRIVAAGSVPDELERRTRLTAEVNAQLFAATRPGATGRELYEVAARGYAAAGFPGEVHLHHQGGAIGYRAREWVAHPRSTEVVQEDQAFAWNPSITGTKTEETCVVGGDSLEVVTTTPDWTYIEAEAGGRTYKLPGVLSL